MEAIIIIPRFYMQQAMTTMVRLILGKPYHVECNDCSRSGKPIREVSNLTLIFYFLLSVGLVIVLSVTHFSAFLVSLLIGILFLVMLMFLTSRYAKPKCGYCRSLNVKKIPVQPYSEDQETISEKANSCDGLNSDTCNTENCEDCTYDICDENCNCVIKENDETTTIEDYAEDHLATNNDSEVPSEDNKN